MSSAPSSMTLTAQPADIALGVVGQQDLLGPRQHQQGGIEIRPRADIDRSLDARAAVECLTKKVLTQPDYFLIRPTALSCSCDASSPGTRSLPT